MSTEVGKGRWNLPKHLEEELATNLLEKDYQLFGKYARSDEETRAMADRELGDKTLTEVLFEMREGR